MDPNACWDMIKEHIRNGEWEEAEEAMANLREWCERGGFLPSELS